MLTVRAKLPVQYSTVKWTEHYISSLHFTVQLGWPDSLLRSYWFSPAVHFHLSCIHFQTHIFKRLSSPNNTINPTRKRCLKITLTSGSITTLRRSMSFPETAVKCLKKTSTITISQPNVKYVCPCSSSKFITIDQNNSIFARFPFKEILFCIMFFRNCVVK